MKKLNIILLAVLGIFALASCDDFLDMQPTNQAESSEAIKTAADAQIMMNGIMSKMTSSSLYGRNITLYADAKGGDLTIYSAGRGNDALYSFNHSPSSGTYSGFWTVGYNIILQINNLLENIAKIESDSNNIENFDNIKGQAYTLRAMIYFDLVRLYGKSYTQGTPGTDWGVPKITTVIDASSQPLRATVKEIYDQILEDLTAGASVISKSKSSGFINYYGNVALQARVHLTMGNNASALAAAEEIINSKVYTLYDNDEWVASWSKSYSSESIFELAMLPTENDLGTSSLGAYYSRQGHYSKSCLGFYGASDYFIARLAEDPDDVRHGVMSYDEKSESYDKTEFAGQGVRMGARYKYLGGVSMVGDDPEKGSATSCNVKLIRLSEIYLIAAEAALASDKDKAAEYLNAIRKRSPNLAPATGSTVTLDMILDEKSKEMFGEGQRYWDMLRLGRTIEFNDEINGAGIAHREKIIDTKTFYKCILPIFQDEINANAPIGEQQNPGYK